MSLYFYSCEISKVFSKNLPKKKKNHPVSDSFVSVTTLYDHAEQKSISKFNFVLHFVDLYTFRYLG